MMRLAPWIAAVLTLAALLDGANQPTPTLVSFDDLQKRLDSPSFRLIDVRPRADYEKGHMPGALWVDINAVQKIAATPGALTDKTAWEAWVTSLGIDPEMDVLVYDGNRQLDAARLWWLLRYLGVDNAGLIDGGFPLWSKQARPTTVETPTIKPRPFPITFRTERLANRDEVLQAIKGPGSARLVDARSEAEHTGAEKRAKRGGHIPSACQLEWSNLVDADGRFLDKSALRALVDKLGVKRGEAVITHCQSGGRASVDAFVFERLGFPTRNYYLGWSDWGNADDTPVATSSEPTKKP
jgi:thiosulfate/3-mercaptopyruvate sulfurtransferase